MNRHHTEIDMDQVNTTCRQDEANGFFEVGLRMEIFIDLHNI